MYLIVEMDEDHGKSVDVIPESWYDYSKRMCSWPPVKNPIPYVEKCKHVEDTWPTYRARILHKIDNYAEARRSLIKAEYTSDLEKSDFDITPKRKRSCVSKRLTTNTRSDQDFDSDESDTVRDSSKLAKPPGLITVDRLNSMPTESFNPNNLASEGRKESFPYTGEINQFLEPGRLAVL